MNKLTWFVIAITFLAIFAQEEPVLEKHEVIDKEVPQDSSIFPDIEPTFSKAKKKLENLPKTISKYGSAIGNKALNLPNALTKEVSQIGNRITNLPSAMSKKVNSLGSQVHGLFQKVSGFFGNQEKELEPEPLEEEQVAQEDKEVFTKSTIDSSSTKENSNEQNEKERLLQKASSFDNTQKDVQTTDNKVQDPVKIREKEEIQKEGVHQKRQKTKRLEVETNQHDSIMFGEKESNKNEDFEKEDETKTREPSAVINSHLKRVEANNIGGFFGSIWNTFERIKDFSLNTVKSLKEKVSNLVPDKTANRWKSVRRKLNETTTTISTGFWNLKQKIKNFTQGSLKQPIKSITSKVANAFDNTTLVQNTQGALQKIKQRFSTATRMVTQGWSRILGLVSTNNLNHLGNQIVEKFNNVTDFIGKQKSKINLTTVSEIFKGIKNSAQKLPDRFEKTFGSMFSFWKMLFFKGFAGVSNIFNQVSSLIGNIISGISYIFKSGLFPILKSIGNVLYKVINFVTNTVSFFTDSMRDILFIVIVIAIVLVSLYFLPVLMPILGIIGSVISNLVSGTFGVMSLLKGIISCLLRKRAPSQNNRKHKEEEKQRNPKPSEGGTRRRAKERSISPINQNRQRFYGYFKCSECNGKWESKNTFEDCPQECKSCGTNVFPYWQIQLLKNHEKQEKSKQQNYISKETDEIIQDKKND